MLNIFKFVTRNKEILPKRALNPEMDDEVGKGKRGGGGRVSVYPGGLYYCMYYKDSEDLDLSQTMISCKLQPIYTPITNGSVSFTKEITKVSECTLTTGPLSSLDTLLRLRSPLQTKMAAVRSKRTSLENPMEK